ARPRPGECSPRGLRHHCRPLTPDFGVLTGSGVTCPREGPPEVPVGVRVGVTESVGVGVGVGEPPPPTVTRPILFVPSVNQMFPSGPAVIPSGLEAVISEVTTPEVVIRPITVPAVYQSAPSGPCVTSNAAAVGSAKCVMTPLVVMRSILP